MTRKVLLLRAAAYALEAAECYTQWSTKLMWRKRALELLTEAMER